MPKKQDAITSRDKRAWVKLNKGEAKVKSSIIADAYGIVKEHSVRATIAHGAHPESFRKRER